LAGQVFIVSAFYSYPNAHLQPLESLKPWWDGFRLIKANAQEVMAYLHGRAPRTWSVGYAIDNAIFPIWVALGSAVTFLTHPLRVQLTAEEQAASSRARLAELIQFDGRPLLAQLAAAVTTECGVGLGLPPSNQVEQTQPTPAPPASAQIGEATEPQPPKHSSDFRSVVWYGTPFQFTPTQAACVKVLWREWENGTPEVGEDAILEDPEVEADAKRLIDVFRDKKSPTGYHPAWRTMIVVGATKGSYRLKSADIS
jgi:hypothetical protein